MVSVINNEVLGVACGRAFGYIFLVPQKDTASIPNAIHSHRKCEGFIMILIAD